MGKFETLPARADVFLEGDSQFVRLPDGFHIEGGKVAVRRDGDAVILEPIKEDRFGSPEARAAFWAAIDGACDEPFPERIVDEGPLREIDLDA